MKKNELVIFETIDNTVKLEVPVNNETVWLTQAQMTELFNVDRTVIIRHVNNIFKEGELDKESNVQKMHIANSDKPVGYYNLDVIISVGYRVKSKRGVEFRKWNIILRGQNQFNTVFPILWQYSFLFLHLYAQLYSIKNIKLHILT